MYVAFYYLLIKKLFINTSVNFTNICVNFDALSFILDI